MVSFYASEDAKCGCLIIRGRAVGRQLQCHQEHVRNADPWATPEAPRQGTVLGIREPQKRAAHGRGLSPGDSRVLCAMTASVQTPATLPSGQVTQTSRQPSVFVVG